MINKREIGARYEEIASKYLQNMGYTILDRNYRCHKGEIDIIARCGDVIVFVEVKYRINNLKGDPAEAVTKSKQRTISKVAEYYLLEKYGTTDIACRFDVVSVLEDEIVHYENAFDYTP